METGLLTLQFNLLKNEIDWWVTETKLRKIIGILIILVKLPTITWGRAQNLIKVCREVIKEKKTQRIVIQSCIEHLFHNRWQFSLLLSSLLFPFGLVPLCPGPPPHSHRYTYSINLVAFLLTLITGFTAIYTIFRKGYISLISSKKIPLSNHKVMVDEKEILGNC